MAAANGFSFGELAAVAAGERPPREVSVRVADLLKWQAYANALLTGASLGMLLFFASWAIAAITGEAMLGKPWRRLRSGFLAIAIGSICLTLGCLAFRLQSVGSQNLSLASAIHSLLWGGLGFVVVISGAKRQAGSGWKMPRAVLAGLLWGACFPILIVMLFPGVYVEQLFSTDTAIAIWGGVGCGLLLAGSLLDLWTESTQVETK